jgi:hypothetical protein
MVPWVQSSIHIQHGWPCPPPPPRAQSTDSSKCTSGMVDGHLAKGGGAWGEQIRHITLLLGWEQH